MMKLLKKVSVNIERLLLVVLVFLLPFERIPSWKLYGLTVRLSLFAALAVIMRAAFLLISKRIKLRLGTIEAFLLCFCVWIVLIIPASINITRAIQVVAATVLTILTAISVSILLKKEYLPSIFKALLLASGIVFIFAVYQYFGDILGLPNSMTGLRPQYSWQVFGFPRVQSTALEPLFLAAFLLLPLGLVLSNLLLTRKFESGKTKTALLILYSGLAGLLSLTISRGALIAFLVMNVVVIVWGVLREKVAMKRVGIIMSAVLVGYLCSLLLITFVNKPYAIHKNGSSQKTYISHVTDTKEIFDTTGDDRAKARRLALGYFKSSPVFGIGPGQFGPKVQNNKKAPAGWGTVNNETAEILAETGLVGFLILGLFSATLIFAAYRSLGSNIDGDVRLFLIGLLGFLAATFIQYQTFSTLYIMHIWVAIGLLMGCIRLAQARPTGK